MTHSPSIKVILESVDSYETIGRRVASLILREAAIENRMGATVNVKLGTEVKFGGEGGNTEITLTGSKSGGHVHIVVSS